MNLRELFEIDLGEIAVGEMIDVGATGTFDFTDKLPAGILPIAGKIQNLEAFAGQATVLGELGTAGDPDAYIASGTVMTLAAINAVKGAAPTVGLGADQTVRLTITATTDFTLVTAGKVRCSLFCVDLNGDTVLAS